MPERGLGRITAPDDKHIQKFPMLRSTMPTTPAPVVLGINWYTTFDDPEPFDNGYCIGRGSDWGTLRGGHAICLMPPSMTDPKGYWHFYNQGNEGACVGFASSRMMSLLNRKRYDANWLYHQAQLTDEFPGEDYSGTTVRAAMEVLRTQGHAWVRGSKTYGPDPNDGIMVYRWGASVEDIAQCLSPGDGGKGILNRGYLEFLNSWGDDPNDGYPHVTRLPLDAAHRLCFKEEGDVCISTDR